MPTIKEWALEERYVEKIIPQMNVDMKGKKTRNEFGQEKNIEKREGGQER
jgi:hypothetical protein